MTPSLLKHQSVLSNQYVLGFEGRIKSTHQFRQFLVQNDLLLPVKPPAHSCGFHFTLYDLRKKLDHVEMVFDVGIVSDILILISDKLDA
jgi:hypothetical protein